MGKTRQIKTEKLRGDKLRNDSKKLDRMKTMTELIQGVPKNLLYSGEQYIVVSLFSFVFPGV